MKAIEEALIEIEADKRIEILFACETGSRAWGFPSTDSDYDVRFIYRHERDWYLGLGERKDTIESMNGDLDITGWDLRKSLKLLKKSNAPLIERFQSPIVYRDTQNFKDEFSQLVELYYSPTAIFYHHYSLAKKFWTELKDRRSVKLKALFYLLRSLLSCNWIIEDQSVVPMKIQELLIKVDHEVRADIERLIELKAGVDESYFYELDPRLIVWIEELFRKTEEGKQELLVSQERGFSKLNEFFIRKLV
jgi:uncharacterized protein